MGEVFEQTTNFVNPDKGEIELWSLTVEDGLTPKSERYNREFLVKKNANFKKVRPGDIVYNPMNMTLGAVGYNGMLKNVAVSGYYITMFVKTGYDSYYINTWLKSPQALSLYKTFATGSLIEKQRVQFSTLSIIPTVFPEYEEQKRIGCYFNNLDSLITFHHRKLNILNKICRYAWEQRKVLDLLIQPITDGPHETPKLVEKGVPFISVDAIVDNKIDFNRKRGNISEEYDELCCKKYKPQFHDVYLVKSGSTVGKVAIVETTDRFNIWSPLAAMRCGEKTYPYFLYDLLQTKDLQAQVADKASNGTQPNLSMRELEKFPVSVPSNLEEQKKIGDYFRSLDHLITLHQRKCDETKKLKKCMLQKMFPKEGEKVPEIRFSGFTGDWKQRKLGEIVNRITRKNSKLISELPLTISAQQGLIDQNEFFDKRVASKDVSGYYLIKNGEFAYNRSTSNDAPWGAIKRLDRYENGVLSTLYIVFEIKDETLVNSDFLVAYYNTNLWHKGIHEIAAEGARNHGLLNIAPTDFFKTKLKLPADIEEQQEIGEYFKKIDSLITFHQQKCDELKNIKKFMLQNMFVSEK